MEWYEILIIVLAALFVVGIAVWQVIRKKQGKSGCDCGSCSQCSGCPSCRASKKEPQEKQENRHTQSP